MMRARSPDGREWELRSYRFRMPPWRDQDLGDEWDGTLVGGGIYAVETLFGSVIAPLAIGLVELPVTLVRAPFTRTRWIEAVCRDPAEIRILWRSSRAHVEQAKTEIASQLELGYTLDPTGAELVDMTPPPGVDDLST
jgi:hypothetical protein